MSDTIVAICSVISLIISLFLITKDFLKSRIKLRVKVIDYVSTNGIVQLYLHIYNQSSSMATISSFKLSLKDRSVTCELLPKKIKSFGSTMFMTPEFPLNISPHEGLNVFLEFLDCGDIQLMKGNLLSLTVHTNLKPLKINEFLPDESYYLHIRK